MEIEFNIVFAIFFQYYLDSLLLALDIVKYIKKESTPPKAKNTSLIILRIKYPTKPVTPPKPTLATNELRSITIIILYPRG